MLGLTCGLVWPVSAQNDSNNRPPRPSAAGATSNDGPVVIDVAGRVGPAGEARWERQAASGWAEALRETAGNRGTTSFLAWARARPVGVAPAQLEAIRRTERWLIAARRAAIALDERTALSALGLAVRALEADAAVPGVAAWLAEAHLAMAVVAAQAGRDALFEAALERAAIFDGGRVLRAAEAPPAVVARAEAVLRGVATRPRGRFVVRSTPAGASVFVDDRLQGETPLEVQVPTGRHVLRLEAPGQVPFGTLIDVFEGTRAPIVASLAATETFRLAEKAAARSAAGDLAGVLEVLAALGPAAPEVWWVRARGDRAVVARCDARGCEGPIRVEGAPGSWPARSPSRWAHAAAATAHARSLAWLDARLGTLASSPMPRAMPPRRRWATWLTTGVVIVGAGVAAGLTLRRSPQDALQIPVDLGGLPGGEP